MCIHTIRSLVWEWELQFPCSSVAWRADTVTAPRNPHSSTHNREHGKKDHSNTWNAISLDTTQMDVSRNRCIKRYCANPVVPHGTVNRGYSNPRCKCETKEMRTLRLRVQTITHFSRELHKHVTHAVTCSWRSWTHFGFKVCKGEQTCFLWPDALSMCRWLCVAPSDWWASATLTCKQLLVSSVYWSTMRSTERLFSCLLPFFKLHDTRKRTSFSSRDPNHCTGTHRTPKQNSA